MPRGSGPPLELFGTTTSGVDVHRLRLENEHLAVDVLTRGATIQALALKRPDGGATDVVLGCPDLPGYEADRSYLGAVVGRYANRIAESRFTLDGTTYELARNEGPHTLHGGPDGFDRQVWTVTGEGSVRVPAVSLEHLSPDGTMGFPGTLRATCRYVLDGPALTIELRATADRATVVGLTQHAYFNLAGDGQGPVDDHELWVDADRFLPTDEAGIPLPGSRSVTHTPFDFRTPDRVGPHLHDADEQVRLVSGLDHCLLLNDPQLDRPSARLRDPASGRTLEVFTDQPGMQVYTGNNLDGTVAAKRGPYRRHDGICLETQRLPNGPNRPDSEAVVLRPGEEYVARTVWRFSESGAGSR